MISIPTSIMCIKFKKKKNKKKLNNKTVTITKKVMQLDYVKKAQAEYRFRFLPQYYYKKNPSAKDIAYVQSYIKPKIIKKRKTLINN